MLKQCDQTKQQAQQSSQQLRVSIAKLSSLDEGNKRLDLCGVSRIVVRIFLHQRRRRFYAARRSEARASENILPFSSHAAASAQSRREKQSRALTRLSCFGDLQSLQPRANRNYLNSERKKAERDTPHPPIGCPARLTV
jgi:hypothetical protein